MTNPAFTNWDIGGQVRARFEAKSGFAVGRVPNCGGFQRATPDNNYWLLREKVHVGWKPGVLGEALWRRPGQPVFEDKRTSLARRGHLRLAPGCVTLGNPKEFPVTLKVGRQELSYGDERLVGAFDWNNIGRVFDAAKLRYENARPLGGCVHRPGRARNDESSTWPTITIGSPAFMLRPGP